MPRPSSARTKATQRSADFSEMGVSGLPVFSGRVREEFLPALVGQNAFKVFREMSSNDPIISGILLAIEQLTRQVQWKVQSDGSDDERTDFIDGALFDDMSFTWPDTLSEILTFLPYGWAYMEIVYKRRNGPGSDPRQRSNFKDGKIGWRKWALRGQSSLSEWKLDEAGGVQAMVQVAPPDYAPRTIPIDKALLFRTKIARNNPEGYSVLRGSYRPWYFKRRIEEIEGIGIERDLAGLPVIYGPEKLDLMAAVNSEKKRAALDLVTQIKRDEQEGVVMNHGWKLELLSTGGRRQFDTTTILDRYDHRIAVTVLADFMLLGTKSVGSFALSADKTQLFSIALGAYLDNICSVINRHAIPRLLELNGMPTEDAPQLTHGDIEAQDLGKLGEFIEKMVNAGAIQFPTKDHALERDLLERAHLPVPPDDGWPELPLPIPVPELEPEPQPTTQPDLTAQEDE